MSRPRSVGRAAAWVILPACLAAAPMLAQTSPSQPNGSLAGRVIDATTGQPIAGVEVMIDAQTRGGSRGTVRTGRTATTDATGAFVFGDVAPGGHRIEASMPGYRHGYAGAVTAQETFQRELVQVSPREPSRAPHFIVLVPAAARAGGAQRAHYTRPAADGSFLIMGVLDGAYALAVVEDVPADDLNNPAALDRLRGVAAMTLTFGRGEHKRQDLAIRSRESFFRLTIDRIAQQFGPKSAGKMTPGFELPSR